MDELSQKLAETGNDKLCPTILIFKDNKVLVGFRHYTSDKYKNVSVWTIPGGRCDEGETVETTLRREVAEEVGITDLNITAFVGEVVGAKEGDIVYLFKGSTDQDFTLMEPEKFSEWKWVDKTNIPENFISTQALELIRQQL